jgi:hypothetical protein
VIVLPLLSSTMPPTANLPFLGEAALPFCDAQCTKSIAWRRDIESDAHLSRQAKIGIISAGIVAFSLLLVLAYLVLRCRRVQEVPESPLGGTPGALVCETSATRRRQQYFSAVSERSVFLLSVGYDMQPSSVSELPGRDSLPIDVSGETLSSPYFVELGGPSETGAESLGSGVTRKSSFGATYGDPKDIWGPSLREQEILASQHGPTMGRGIESRSTDDVATGTALTPPDSTAEISVPGMTVRCEAGGCVQSFTSKGDYKYDPTSKFLNRADVK